MRYQEKVRAYFDAWLRRDADVLPALFADDAVYSECYGPEYHGLRQIQRWFAAWNLRGTVLVWDIKNVIESGSTCCVEWFFRCRYDGEEGGFDGVSWIEWNEAGRIAALREFQSKAEHVCPFEEVGYEGA